MKQADERLYLSEFQQLEAAIKSLLAGHGPMLQGAILGDLVAMWLAGHPAENRAWLLGRHIEMVRKMLPVNEAALFGDGGNPLNGTTEPA
jgi:hypothetical protein